MPDFRIEPEFRDYIRKLSPDEYQELSNQIEQYGCTDALVIWKEERILIDGHNRYAICNDLQKPYEIRYESFASRNDVKIWMIKRQVGRRNLDAHDRAENALKLIPLLEIQAKERMLAGVKPGQNEDPAALGQQGSHRAPTSAETAADITGSSARSVARLKFITEHGSPEIIAAVDAKTMSMNEAERRIRESMNPPAESVLADSAEVPPEIDAELDIDAESPATERTTHSPPRDTKGWGDVREKLFESVRVFVRKHPDVRVAAAGDLRKFAKSLERNV